MEEFLTAIITKRTDDSLRKTARMLGAQQHLDVGYVAAIKDHNPQATKAKHAARRVTARVTANTFLRALALRVLSPQETQGCIPKDLLDRGFTIQLAGGAKKCAGLTYQVILGRTHTVRSWGGQGGRNYTDFRSDVKKLKLDHNITETEAVARLQAVEGKLRHPYLVGLDGKASGGKGDRNYDDFWRVVEKLKTDFGITETTAIARLQAVKGIERHSHLAKTAASKVNFAVANAEKYARADELHELLVASLTSSDPTWILQVWYDEVKSSTGALNGSQKELAKHRAKEYKVGSKDDYITLNEKIRGMTLPEQPPRNATIQAKDAWRTE
jgi:hypothetical protein